MLGWRRSVRTWSPAHVEPRQQRRLEQDRRVVGVDEDRATHLDPQTSRGRPAVDPVVRVRRVVDELATFLEPGVDGVPGHADIPGRLRHVLVGEIADLLDPEGVREMVPGTVDHEHPLGVDHRLVADEALNPSRVGLDVGDVAGDGNREPAGARLAERTVSVGQRHIAVLSSTAFDGSAKPRTMASTVKDARSAPASS